MPFDLKKSAEILVDAEGPDTSKRPEPSRTVKPPMNADDMEESIVERYRRYNDSNGSDFTYHHSASYYESFAGPNTSHFLFEHICYELGLLGEPVYLNTNYGIKGHYDRKLAARVSKSDHSSEEAVAATLAQLKALLSARVLELGLDRETLENWMVTPHSLQEDQRFHLLPFEEQMKTFRALHRSVNILKDEEQSR